MTAQRSRKAPHGKYWFLLIVLATIMMNGIILMIPSCVSPEKPDKHDEPLPDKEQLMEHQSAIVDYESQDIEKYISRMGYHMAKTGTGLRYQIVVHGSGTVEPVAGDLVELAYKVLLLDGTLLYSSDSLGSLKFKVDQSDMASGLHEGVKFMREGDKAVFIMPSHLAYGLTGDGGLISHYKVLVVESELLALKHEK